MQVTVQDILSLDQLKSFRLLAGAKGLSRPISKVGILDFEYTKRGASQLVDRHWMPNEFVLSTFLYAKDNDALLFEAVKKLNASKASGIAIKNIFDLEIRSDLIRYADSNDFPIFIFTDQSLFFEDIIIDVNRLLTSVTDNNWLEKEVAALLYGSHNKNTIKKLSHRINYAFKNTFVVGYFEIKNQEKRKILPTLLFKSQDQQILGKSASLIKYKNGFFCVYSTDSAKQIKPQNMITDIESFFDLQPSDVHIGLSSVQYDLSNFKKALRQSLYAATYSKIYSLNMSFYHDLGAYQLLLSSCDEEWVDDFYQSIIAPIIEFDITNKTNLLETAVVYEACHGNRKEMASRLFTHENTVRYRMKKIAEIIDDEGKYENFDEQLSLAVKIHRIKTANQSEDGQV